MPKTTLVFSVGVAGLLAFSVSLFSAHGAGPKVDISKIPPAATKTGVTYSADIKPIFETSCVKCHGAEKPKGKLRLDSREGVIKGSEHGKVLTPGKATESQLLVSVARQGDPDLHMPPTDNKAKIPPLTPAQVGLIRAWIEQGAN